MTAIGWMQIALFFVVVLALTRPIGAYMFHVFEGARQPFPAVLGRAERFLCRLCGVDPSREQSWPAYAFSLLAFSLSGMLVTYGIERLQHVLPLNPQHLGPVEPALAFNTAASFTTNTDWQAYTPESTMGYLAQMAGLAWHNFTSAAAGIAIALALARGFTRTGGATGGKTIGNFWVDLIRATVYVLLPLSFGYALFLVSQGVLQNLAPYRELATLEGAKQVLAMGPTASQEAIKMLGTNGGGFFNANSAHPFENPTPLTNFVQMVSIFAIPAGLTYTYGRMARDQRQGWALFAAMAILFFVGVLGTYAAEAGENPALRGIAGLQQGAGNLEGKETRFGLAASALFATVTTDASCGAVNSMHDSFTPLGGLVPLVNIQLGEVIFGGAGAGLYGMLVFVVLTVFIAGLMVGRTPEYLGKKIEAREMKLAMLYVLIFPLLILGFAAWSAVATYGVSSMSNRGPHGLSQILYAFSSGAGNNGSAFAGLDANRRFYNLALGFEMLFGRFFMIVPALGIAGAMVDKKVIPAGPGTFPTNGVLFVALLVSVVVIVGALTFFPALSLGPLAEHFSGAAGRVF
jgi:potassium-transporting ATPase potassium-binding subunit